MNKIFPLIFALTGFLFTTQNCNTVKTGTYIIENENYGFSVLIRKESSQEEIIEQLGIHSKFDLIWIDECNYALFNRTILKGSDMFPKAKKTDTLFIEVIGVSSTGYEFRATSNFSNFVSTGFAKTDK
ncbi:hypothetical protein [Psychroserpens sp. S379A]|uniref:hypothetical protein n=1 Tax=Psychroserpens sp. S379A TaxID=3415137 RepID=UPI003C79FF49